MKALSSGLIALCCLLSASGLYADDTEIYLSPSLSGSEAQVMVLIDTSGSMLWCEDELGTNRNGVIPCSDVPNRRINQLKEAFTNVVDSLGGGISMGVGRYRQSGSGNGLGSGIGGYVMREVEPLDDLINAQVLHAVEDEYGDIVEDDSGNLQVTSSTIAFPNGGRADSSVGMFFPSVDVPRYAVIKTAILEVDPSEDASGQMQLEAAFDVADIHAPFTALNTVADRSWSTGYTTSVTLPWERNKSRGSVDVTELVQAATSRSSWCGGQGLALRFRSLPPHNTREIYAYGAVNGDAPRLRVTWGPNENLNVAGGPADGQAYTDQLSCNQGMAYSLENVDDDAWESTQGKVELDSSSLPVEQSQVAGWRFAAIPFDLRTSQALPDVVEKAVLRFRGAKGATKLERVRVCRRWGCRYETQERPEYGDVTLTIKAEQGSGAAFQDSNLNISGRATGASVSYVTEGAYGEFDGADVIHEVDVTSIVTAAMSNSGWQSGGRLVLTVSADKDVKLAAVESGQANGASLVITALSADLSHYGERVRDELKRIVNNLSPNGGTPLMEAYTEMAKYMMGQKAVFARGEQDAVGFDQSGVYRSPLDSNAGQCSSNHIILMTDGEPTSDTAYGQVTSTTGEGGDCDGGFESKSAEASFSCMKQLATWLYDGTENSKKSAVQTHTVGFHLDEATAAQLAEVADAGQGSALTAASATELESALRQIINSISDVNSTVAAPGVAVNQLNRMQHLDQLYYAIFGPEMDSRWEGNLKRYRLALGSDAPQLVDRDGKSAVDPNTGFFAENSRSFWSQEQDGPEVEKGGARSLLGSDDRRLFVADSSNTDSLGSATATSANTSQIKRVMAPDELTKAAYGLDTSATDDQRNLLFGKLMESWGDPLHSEPRLVNYGYTGDLDEARTDPDKQDNVLFVSTNDGMLHALNAKSGEEYFTFIPAEQAEMAAKRYSQPALDSDNNRTTYGLDSSWTVWRQPNPANLTKVDKVYLYGGMRRGGRNYYALDVSNKTTPRWMWRIRGGFGDFVELGQTWSTPTLGQVMLDDKAVPVLIFGGGYSPFDHDTQGQFSASGDIAGNAIYVVNAYTGG
ncbi:MAG: pilus assembly protein, partial [Alcanivorax sediminis]|uniref:pilus assembly protein n=1 Tax=Alcanivorax sediminis TaxID=2663008 RepID=UPI003C39A3B3